MTVLHPHDAPVDLRGSGPPRTPPEPASAEGDLLATVCHDLRAPLSAIVMGSTFLLRQLAGDAEALQVVPARKMAEAIRRSAARMDRVIGDYHDLARIEAGRVELAMATLDAREVLERARDALASDGDEPRISVEIAAREARDADEAPLRARADGERLLQILGKLARNAAEASPADSPVRMSVARSGDAVLFRVEDAGRGIDAEILPHIFDYRWIASRRARKGLGLGLGIARGWILAMHGELRVEHTSARGTSMVFTLPQA